MSWLAKPIVMLALAGALAIALLFATGQCSSATRKATEARVSANRGAAGVESGKDAVGAVAARGGQEAAIQDKVKGTGNAIDRANDAGAADTAARGGLCDVDPAYCR